MRMSSTSTCTLLADVRLEVLGASVQAGDPFLVHGLDPRHELEERRLVAICALERHQGLAQPWVDELAVVQDLQLFDHRVAAAILVLQHLVVVRAHLHVRVLPRHALVPRESLAQSEPIDFDRIDFLRAEVLEVVLQAAVHLLFGVALLEGPLLFIIHGLLVRGLEERLTARPSITFAGG